MDKLKPMIKLLCILALLSLAVVSLTACSVARYAFLEKRGMLQSEAGNYDMLKSFLYAAQDGDINAMKDAFAPAVVSEVGAAELERMLAGFAGYFEGEITAIEAAFGETTDETSIDGKKSLEICAPYVMTTTSGEYRLVVKFVARDDWNADNIGIWSVYIINSENDVDSEQPYKGDMAYRTGAYTDVPRLR